MGDFRKAWSRACVAASVPERLVHDLRRTAARLGGPVSRVDLRFNGKVTARNPVAAGSES
ncbi:MAG: hypothetical protein H0T48_02100 [Gemmatimonadaceae bacterium]|nr:hypothetical protein [Gemmatimonadaceae bacterium]